VNENGVLAGSIDVVNGVVYVYTTSNQIEAFNASGQTDCSGSPKVCQPLWSAAGPFSTPPTISGGTMFAQASGGPLEAFDASGQIDCSGSPRVCQPQWSSSFTATGNEVTVSGGNVYVGNASGGAGNVVAALDATGTRNCGGSPKVCSPRWDYHTNYTSDGFPVVSGSTLYIDTLQRVSLHGPRSVRCQWGERVQRYAVDLLTALDWQRLFIVAVSRGRQRGFRRRFRASRVRRLRCEWIRESRVVIVGGR
jgi:outer membrane protein assembly factor BamB